MFFLQLFFLQYVFFTAITILTTLFSSATQTANILDIVQYIVLQYIHYSARKLS